MWKYVFPPLLTVVILWILVSFATTLYINWAEEAYRRVVRENYASITEADAIQDGARRIEALFSKEASTDQATTIPLWRPIADGLQTHSRNLSEINVSPDDGKQVALASSLVEEICSLAAEVVSPDSDTDLENKLEVGVSPNSASSDTDDKSRLRQLAAKLTDVMTTIKSVNRQIASESDRTRDFVGAWFGLVRTLLLVAGPIVGLGLGWRLSRKLAKSVGRIDVVLNQTDGLSIGIADVSIKQSNDLSTMEEQAKWIVDRLKQSYADLARSQADMIRAERLASVGRLASGVAHEIRNPLTSIKLLLQNASRLKSTESLSGENLQLILDEISRIEAAIQGLLDYSRPRPQNRSTGSLSETIDHAIALIAGRADQQNVAIHFDEPAQPTMIDADHQQLHQVFVNICINAIEAMPNGGTLWILTRPLVGNRIKIEFRDTGAGIPEATLSQLFEPFNTTKERGTGLGLAVSRAIIEHHYGHIDATNETPNGAKFSIELPTNLSHSPG